MPYSVYLFGYPYTIELITLQSRWLPPFLWDFKRDPLIKLHIEREFPQRVVHPYSAMKLYFSSQNIS